MNNEHETSYEMPQCSFYLTFSIGENKLRMNKTCLCLPYTILCVLIATAY